MMYLACAEGMQVGPHMSGRSVGRVGAAGIRGGGGGRPLTRRRSLTWPRIN